MARTARSKRPVEESFGERLARLRKARGYSRHADLATLCHYDDSRADHHHQLAELVSRKVSL